MAFEKGFSPAPEVMDIGASPEKSMDKPSEGENWTSAIELPADTGGWQDSIELPDDTGEWQDSIELPDDSGDGRIGKNDTELPNERSEYNRQINGVENVENNNEANIEMPDLITEKVSEAIGTPAGIKKLLEEHPEKAELWESQLSAIETLNDPEASPAEIRSAQAKLSVLKGQLLEFAAKDALTEVGFDVETQQRVVEGESGGTRPDIIAANNTEHPITVFGIEIQSGETLSIECKCGGSAYMTNQLNNHIPNQLSGQEGTKALLTTSDIKGVPNGLASSVCDQYGARLVTLDVGVAAVEKAIKEVAEN